MLYFDQIEPGRFGTIRVQIWTLLHFPLHVAILLTEEGSSKFILWWTLVQNYPDVTALQAYLDLTIVGINEIATPERVNKTSTLSRYLVAPTLGSGPMFAKFNEMNLTCKEKVTEILYFTDKTGESVATVVFTSSGILSPPLIVHASDDPVQLSEFITLFDTVFYFFFVAAGCVLISLGLLYWCGKKHKTSGEMASIVCRITAGVGLGLIAVIHTNTTAFRSYILSPWLIPTVVFTFFVGKFLDPS